MVPANSKTKIISEKVPDGDGPSAMVWLSNVLSNSIHRGPMRAICCSRVGKIIFGRRPVDFVLPAGVGVGKMRRGLLSIIQIVFMYELAQTFFNDPFDIYLWQSKDILTLDIQDKCFNFGKA